MNDLSFQKSPDKSQISYFLLCNYIDLFIPVAILESDRLFNHALSLQLGLSWLVTKAILFDLAGRHRKTDFWWSLVGIGKLIFWYHDKK